MKDSKRIWILGYAALAAVALAVYWPAASDLPYNYDEADYVWAGRNGGIWGNATDRNSVPLSEYVRRGIELYRDPSKRSEVSRFLRGSGDLGMYRHYHGPVYYYWLSLMDDLGLRREGAVRTSGLLIHIATGLVLMFGFWTLFPGLAAGAGFATGALFLFNRTALVAATNVTQHGMFTFWCAVTMVLLGLYTRNGSRRSIQAAGAATAVALATVETAAVLGVVALAALAYRNWPPWPNWRAALSQTLWRTLDYAAGFLVAMLVVWPAGVLKLAVVKGFMMLAYFTVSARNNFSPIGPLELLKLKVEASPWELCFLLPVTVVAFWLWRKVPDRDSYFAWIAYTAVFLLILLKITIPFTYYYAPLTMGMTMLAGVVVGYFWKNSRAAGLVLALAATVSLVGSGWQYAGVMREIQAGKSYLTSLLASLGDQRIEGNLLVPYQAVPTLHLYREDLHTIGYDKDWSIERLKQELIQPGTAKIMFCDGAFLKALGEAVHSPRLIDAQGPGGEGLYVVTVTGQ
jgi:hypothetical protein